MFDDGDERLLRRKQIRPKGAKHFDAAGNLDALPLTSPELFGSPVPVTTAAQNTKPKEKELKKSRKSVSVTLRNSFFL